MDEIKREKVNRAIEKMLPSSPLQRKLFRHFQEDSFYGWAVSYEENRRYLALPAMIVDGTLIAREIATDKIMIEVFSIPIKTLYQSEQWNDSFNLEFDKACERLKERIKKC